MTIQIPKHSLIVFACIDSPPTFDSDYVSRKAHITHNFWKKDVPPRRKQHICFASFASSGVYDAICLAKVSQQTSTYQCRVKFTEFTQVPGFRFADVKAKITNSRVLHRMPAELDGIWKCPPATGAEVIRAIESMSESYAKSIIHVIDKMTADPVAIRGHHYLDILAHEHDALRTALAMAEFKSQPLSYYRKEGVSKRAFYTTPVMDVLGESSLEDRQIEVDADHFGGLKKIGSDIRGGRVFLDSVGGSKVTVMNVNRHNLESTLGVDLVLYFEKYGSYLMVQYKRLTKEAGHWRMRPDIQMKKEIARIDGVRSNFTTAATLGSPRGFRLSNDPFFFKFCKADEFTPDQIGMTRGMYLSAMDLRNFLSSPSSEGPRGGNYFGTDNCQRQFPNSLFVMNARLGWLGTGVMSPHAISDIVDAKLEGNSSVMLVSVGDGSHGASSPVPDDDYSADRYDDYSMDHLDIELLRDALDEYEASSAPACSEEDDLPF